MNIKTNKLDIIVFYGPENLQHIRTPFFIRFLIFFKVFILKEVEQVIKETQPKLEKIHGLP